MTENTVNATGTYMGTRPSPLCEAASENDLPPIGAPATRALASIGIERLDQVAERRDAELLALHGFGPRALRILKEALAARGTSTQP